MRCCPALTGCQAKQRCHASRCRAFCHTFMRGLADRVGSAELNWRCAKTCYAGGWSRPECRVMDQADPRRGEPKRPGVALLDLNLGQCRFIVDERASPVRF